MQNKADVFSLQELSKLKDFCNDCVKEGKEINEKRKDDPNYVPEEKEPEPEPPKQEINLGPEESKYEKNESLKDVDDKDIDIILNQNSKYKKPKNVSKARSENFNNAKNMFEPKK